MVKYTETPARELERLVDDLLRLSLTEMSTEHNSKVYDIAVKMLELRPYMKNTKFVKETV